LCPSARPVSKNVSGGSALRSRWPPQPNLAQHRTLWEIHIKIFCGHLGRRSEMSDTILEGDHPRIISVKFGWDWLSSFREDLKKKSSPFFLFLAWRPSRVSEHLGFYY
jgi:hypothetical protein